MRSSTKLVVTVLLSILPNLIFAQKNFQYEDMVHLSIKNERVLDSFLIANGMNNRELKLLISPFEKIQPDVFGEINAHCKRYLVKNLECLESNKATSIFVVTEDKDIVIGGFLNDDQLFIWPTEFLRYQLVDKSLIENTQHNLELCLGITVHHNEQLERITIEKFDNKFDGEYVYTFLFSKDFGFQQFGSNNVMFKSINDSYYVPIQDFDINEYEVMIYLEKLQYRELKKPNCNVVKFKYFEIEYLLIKNQEIIDFGTLMHSERTD